ncbi:histone acetyltransferase subunit NuA4 domain containing protein [Rhypophila sp. PSN 637]
MAESTTPAKANASAPNGTGGGNSNAIGGASANTGSGNGATGGGPGNGADGHGTNSNNVLTAGGIPYYEKQRQHLKDLINRRRALEKKITTIDESIYSKETDYLENTPSGNIIIGFDNYTKGTANAAASRRKTGLMDANRVFSRSSVSYNPNAPEAQTPASTTHSTPGSLAPTPLSTSFKEKDKDGGASGAPTPTSATAGKASSSKKGKKTTASKASGAASRAASAGADDSETDSKDAGATKKIRTNFGTSRKN